MNLQKTTLRNTLLLAVALGLFFIVSVSAVSAVECGSVPTDNCVVTQNTTFDTGEYTLPSGIDIGGDTITLDCNGSTLTSGNLGYSGTGITNVGFDKVTIKNCKIENYLSGILLTWNGPACVGINPATRGVFQNLTLNSSRGLYLRGGPSICGRENTNHIIVDNIIEDGNTGIEAEYIDFNVFANNTVKSRTGIFLSGSSNRNNVTENIFFDNEVSPIHTGVSTVLNDIWLNEINDANITYDGTSNNYCVNGVGNTYLNGTGGPTCECIPLLDDLQITSTEHFCAFNYTLPSGVRIAAGGITLDCRGSTIRSGSSGYSGTGIENIAHDDVTIKNCRIENYLNGVLFTWAGPACIVDRATHGFLTNLTVNASTGFYLRGGPCGSENLYHTVKNNEIFGSVNGINLFAADFNNVSNNILRGDMGIDIPDGSDNNIFHNNFLNTGASDSGIRNNWSLNGEGNYWSDYDTEAEGCFNTEADLFCDDPYTNISGSAGSNDSFPYIVQDGWLLGFNFNILPIQVVEDVDMVRGKTTLVRVPVTFTSLYQNDTITPTVTLYWNNTLAGSHTTTTLEQGNVTNIDFWHVPPEAGEDIEIRVEIEGNSSEGLYSEDEQTTTVRVIDTRDLTIDFVPVDNPNNFQDTVDESTLFIDKTYPLSDGGTIASQSSILVSSESIPSVPILFEINLLLSVRSASILSGHFAEKAVGVTPAGWFSNNSLIAADSVGIAMHPLFDSVLIEEGFRSVAAHELGHTYGLCDEYNETDWNLQNDFSSGLCPNGDKDNDENLDEDCPFGLGCLEIIPAGSIIPWGVSSEEDLIYNFMGDASLQSDRWITTDSYKHLLEEFSHSTPVETSSRLLVTGFYNKENQTTIFNNFYQLDSGLAHNESEFFDGDFSIESFDGQNDILSNYRFNLSFFLVASDGDTIETNITPFSFVIPFEENVSSIAFTNESVIEERNRSESTPNVTLLFPNGGEFFHNELINITWDATDADNDTLFYAVLLSYDNGGNFTTLVFDHNETSFALDSSSLNDCTECLVKVIATDGFNSGSDMSDAVFEMDNNLNITEFAVVYQNVTDVVFKFIINNTLDSVLTNVTWELDTGDGLLEPSEFDFSLQMGEEAFVYVHHNYTSLGGYNISVRAKSDIFIEEEMLGIIV